MYKFAGPGLSADLGKHATCPVDESKGWMEHEKEEGTESPYSSPMLTVVKEPPQLPVNGMTDSNAECTALLILCCGVTSFSDGNP